MSTTEHLGVVKEVAYVRATMEVRVQLGKRAAGDGINLFRLEEEE